MKIRLFFVLIILNTICFGQKSSTIDSLKNVIATTKFDTARVWSLIALCAEYEGPNPNLAYKYYKQAEALSREKKYPRGIVKAITYFTYILDMQGKYDETLKYHLEALEISRKSKLGIIEGKMLSNIGTWYYRKGDYIKTANYFVEATKILEKYNDFESAMILKANTTNVYLALKRYGDCIKLCDEVLTETKNKLDFINITTIQILNNKANALQSQKKYAESIKPLELALSISNKIENKEGVSTSYINLSSSFLQLGNLEKSYDFSKKALKVSKEIDSQTGIRSAYSGISHYFFEKKQGDSAEKYIQLALKVENDIESLEDLHNIYKTYSQISLLKGDMTNWKKYASLADSIEVKVTGEEIRIAAQDIEAKYNLSVKENQILKKDQEIKDSKLRNGILLGSFLAFVILGGLAFYLYQKIQQTKSFKNQILTQQRERERIASEMHDELGGDLTSLMYVAHNLKAKNPESAELNKIVNISSEISDNVNDIIWSLNKEKNTLKDWVIYSKGRLSEILENSNLDYSFEISDEIPDRILNDIEKRNLYLVVKEAVNNAIKHADAKNLWVKMDFKDGIKIIIKDDGKGIIENNNAKASGGNGLKNMKARINTIKGEIAWKNQNGTEIEISLT